MSSEVFGETTESNTDNFENERRRGRLARISYDAYVELYKNRIKGRKISVVISPLLCDVEETIIIENKTISSLFVNPPLKGDPDAPESASRFVDPMDEPTNEYIPRIWRD